MLRTRALLFFVLLLVSTLLLVAGCRSDGDAPSTSAETATPAIGTETQGASTATPDSADATPTIGAPIEPARVLSRGDPSRREVALTFDAGSDAGYTADILETLRREGVRASFGVTGLWAEENRDLMLAISASGHLLINHTYDHRSFTGLSSGAAPLTNEERASELSRTETTIFRLTGRSTRPYFRPPFGDLDPLVLRDVAANGYDVVVMWTVDTFGWKRVTADEVVERSLRLAEPGAIYVMHVGSESQDGPALPRIIDGLRAMGYAFVTVDEMVR
ncbi:MAG TPA: polysaccharide deacetylase family protein [Dehalococcoidia bacterium]